MNNIKRVKKIKCYKKKIKKAQVGKYNFDNQFYYRFDIRQVLSGNLAMYFRMNKIT